MQASELIYHYEDPIEFLNAQLRERQKRNPRFSLRAWATQLGYRNPSLLFQVLRRERRLKMELALKIAHNLQLTGKALRYFELAVLSCGSQNQTEKKVLESSMAKLRPKSVQPLRGLSLELFSAVSEWYHWAILSLTELRDFKPDAAWIQDKLGPDLDKKTIQRAVDRLTTLGLLVLQPDGRYVRMDHESSILMENSIPSAAIRQYHTQMVDKSRAAIEGQTVEERTLRATTMTFDKKDLPMVEEILADAHRQIAEFAAQREGDELYQLNSQFFRLTQKKMERGH